MDRSGIDSSIYSQGECVGVVDRVRFSTVLGGVRKTG